MQFEYPDSPSVKSLLGDFAEDEVQPGFDGGVQGQLTTLGVQHFDFLGYPVPIQSYPLDYQNNMVEFQQPTYGV